MLSGVVVAKEDEDAAGVVNDTDADIGGAVGVALLHGFLRDLQGRVELERLDLQERRWLVARGRMEGGEKAEGQDNRDEFHMVP